VLLFTPDVDRQLAFYTQVLGLKLSDRCQRIIAFLRCSSDHHNVAFLSSKGPGFHHGSFEVGGVDEIAMGAQCMRASGWEPGWGLGRHVIGSNYFYYIRDPWGSFAEYFFDLDHIPRAVRGSHAIFRSRMPCIAGAPSRRRILARIRSWVTGWVCKGQQAPCQAFVPGGPLMELYADSVSACGHERGGRVANGGLVVGRYSATWRR
jgi:catechol 2,3-dioxygenase-like lactoylglutathione lyase family enzyme